MQQYHFLTHILNLIGVVILLVGSISSVLIYRSAGNEPRDVLGYEQGYGAVYPIRPEDSKAYQRSLELYGGKANALSDELRRWFIGLWHGKSLAFTVAAITILICLGLFFVADYLLPLLAYDEDNEDNRGDTG